MNNMNKSTDQTDKASKDQSRASDQSRNSQPGEQKDRRATESSTHDRPFSASRNEDDMSNKSTMNKDVDADFNSDENDSEGQKKSFSDQRGAAGSMPKKQQPQSETRR